MKGRRGSLVGDDQPAGGDKTQYLLDDTSGKDVEQTEGKPPTSDTR
jgi:hypothetical protein